MTQVFIKFKPDVFWISKNNTFKNIIEHVKYMYVYCLNQFQNNSLYFKYQEFGYCLIFSGETALDGKQCFKNINLLKEEDDFKNKEFYLGNIFIN